MNQVLSPFVDDAHGGTLSRDHQSRSMFFNGERRRTYVAYRDHNFNARVTYYDHDTCEWAFPIRIDTCFRGQFTNGHNAPNIFVTKDGFLHIFYGAHNASFKYARSKKPEYIADWDIGMRVGDKGTYPHFTQTADGELLVFYRYGIIHSYNHPYFVVQHSSDQGRHWSEIKRLATFAEGCKICGTNALYDPDIGRVHLVLNVPVNWQDPERRWWRQYYCQYEPDSGKIFTMDGSCIGPIAREEDFDLQPGQAMNKKILNMFLQGGTLFFLFQTPDGNIELGRWENGEFSCWQTPPTVSEGVLPPTLMPYSPDGRVINLYGISVTFPPTSFSGGDVMVWTSRDGGRNWDEGNCLLDRRSLGHGFDKGNLVINCQSTGPRVIVSEKPNEDAAGEKPRTAQDRKDYSGRRDIRLYAIDSSGNIV